MLVAGDFNSVPGSAAHSLLVNRIVENNHPVWNTTSSFTVMLRAYSGHPANYTSHSCVTEQETHADAALSGHCMCKLLCHWSSHCTSLQQQYSAPVTESVPDWLACRSCRTTLWVYCDQPASFSIICIWPVRMQLCMKRATGMQLCKNKSAGWIPSTMSPRLVTVHVCICTERTFCYRW